MVQIPPDAANPRLTGLYAFDFGDWTAIGYTADEVAMLLEQERYRDGSVYKIVRVSPGGQMEMRGVTRSRFELESGMLFFRAGLAEARADYDAMLRAAESTPPPCRAFVQLGELGSADAGPSEARFVTALIYPAEYEDEIAAWLEQADYRGGATVEAGPSVVSNYYDQRTRIIDRRQLWAKTSELSRSRGDVLKSVRRLVQR